VTMFRSGLKTLNVSLHRRTAVDHIRETAEQPGLWSWAGLPEHLRRRESEWGVLAEVI